MRPRFCLQCLLLALAFLPASWARAQVVNQVVAVVGEEIITLRQLDNEIIDRLAELESRLSGEAFKKERGLLRQQALKEMIGDRLADQEAKRLKITVSDEEAKATIERVRTSRHLTPEQLERNLALEGLNMETYLEQIKKQILHSKLVYTEVKTKVFIPDAEKRAVYETRKDKYGGRAEVLLRRLVLTGGDEENLKLVQQKIAQGGDFAQLAKEYSTGPEAKEGGLLGRFELEQLSPEIASALQGLQAGQVSQPVSLRGDWHIFQVAEKNIDTGVSFEDVEEQITQELTYKALAKKYDEWIERVRQRSFVKIMDIPE